MAAAWLSSMISSMFLISRASSITCWPSTTFMPAFCSSKNIAVSAMSTPTGMSATPAAAQQAHDFLGMRLHQPDRRRHGAAHAEHAGAAIVRDQPVAVDAVMHRGRAEVPHDRLAVAGEQREAAQLVAFPFADLGAGDVADVVDVEQQQRAAWRGLQRRRAPAPAGNGAADRNRSGARNRPTCGRATVSPDPSASSVRDARDGSRCGLSAFETFMGMTGWSGLQSIA